MPLKSMYFIIQFNYNIPFFQLDIMDPKVPEDIYKSHLEPNSECLLSYM